MSKEGDHHYVPQFLLKNWGMRKRNGKVKVWTRVDFDGQLHLKYRTTAQFGYEKGLYRLEDVAADKAQFIEQEIFGNQIESEAAPILTKLVRKGATTLNEVERARWAVFVNAFRVRHPLDIADLKEKTAQVLQDVMTDTQQQFGEYPDFERISEEWIDIHNPGYRKNLHWDVGTYLLGSPKLLTQLLGLRWEVFDLTRADQRLLLSDRPLITGTYQPNHSPIFALPITPTRLFVAGDHAAIRYVKTKHVQDLVVFTNINVLLQATRFVCGNAESGLLNRYFRR